MTEPKSKTVLIPVMGTLNEDGTVDMDDAPTEWVEVDRAQLDEALDNMEGRNEPADRLAPRPRH